MVEYKKVTLDDNVVSQLIELSKLWAQEDITFGYVPNERSDLNEPCIVALEGDKIIGYIFGHYYDNEKKIADIAIGDKCFEVDELYVLKEYRSQGIGKRLFELMNEEVKDNVSFITLPTGTKDYKKILKFYVEITDMTFHSAFLFKKTNKK